MTQEAQRLAIAEACGWDITDKDGDVWVGFLHDQVLPFTIPNYPSDLNAMHEAEKVLEIGHDGSDAASYQECLWQLVNPGIKFHSYETLGDVGYLQRFLCSTASQRAEAFLRTLNKWVE